MTTGSHNIGKEHAFPRQEDDRLYGELGMTYRKWLIGQAPPAPGGPSTGKYAVINAAAWAIEWADIVIAMLDSEES